MTYRARCEGRRGKKRDSDEAIARQAAGAHECWSNMAWFEFKRAEGKYRVWPNEWATRRQRRTWQPDGERARANRRRDASLRGEAVEWEPGTYFAKGTRIAPRRGT